MPFKYKKVSYGLPEDSYEKEIINEYIQDITCTLGLTRVPVGVKLIFTEEEFNDINIPKFEGKLSYCCMVEKATRGMSFKSTLENHMCDGGTTALGLEESTEKIESGREYFSYNLYSTPAAARRMREGVIGLYRANVKTYGILVQPLSDFEITPDVVIFVVNPYQSMRLEQGYVYHLGNRIKIESGAMQAVCAEATVRPYLTAEMNITHFCPSTRFLAKWKDDEMAVGIPFEKLKSTIEGVIATVNSTDSVERKKEIMNRFKQCGKNIEFNLDKI